MALFRRSTPDVPVEETAPVELNERVMAGLEPTVTQSEQTTALERTRARVAALQNRFKMSSHHAMERFAGVCLAVVLLLGVMFGSNMAIAGVKDRASQATQVVYTTQTKTSRTGMDVEVLEVYLSPDRSRAMVFMKFSDPLGMSSDANNYEAYATGTKTSGKVADEDLKSDLNGQIVMFGNTGYMGVILDNHGVAFPRQMINLTMRSNVNISPDIPADSEEAAIGQTGSFAQYDQWRVFFNPGADGGTTLDALVGESDQDGALSLRRIFYETVIKGEEQTAREDLDTQLQQMQTAQTRIGEYTNRLANASIVDGNRSVTLQAPPAPSDIAGDQIVGEASKDGSASNLMLETKHVVPGGYDFDWRAGNVMVGYLDGIVPRGESLTNFLKNKKIESAESTSSTPSLSDWTFSDGSDLSEYDPQSIPELKSINETANQLITAWGEYQSLKKSYQTRGLQGLLDLEMRLRDVETNSSVRSGEGTLNTY